MMRITGTAGAVVVVVDTRSSGTSRGLIVQAWFSASPHMEGALHRYRQGYSATPSAGC